MKSALHSRKVQIISVIVIIPLIAIFGFGIYLASLAGDLPWQADPTRISDSFAPFAGIEGFTTPTRIPTRAATPVGTPTAVPTT
jgi:hypothetical protein